MSGTGKPPRPPKPNNAGSDSDLSEEITKEEVEKSETDSDSSDE